MTTLPVEGQRLRFGDGAECIVTAVRPPLASGRFRGMHVVICNWLADGREGTFIAEVSKFTVVPQPLKR